MNAPVLLRPSPRRAASLSVPARKAAATAGVEVQVQSVHKAFRSRIVLDGLDLDIAAGSFVSIVGRSGEGKSTLLRLLAGLDRADAGAIRLDGAEVAGLSPATTMMFQDARLLPWQRVVANVGIARGPGWRSEATAALQDVGLGDRAEDWPRVLSGGQKQRVALARALVHHPGLLLLDEPLGALDALTRAEMQRLIERLWREQGFTAVLVTHDVGEAVALADRIVVLRAGRIALDLPVDLPRPRQRGEAAGLETRVLDALLA